MEWQVCCNPGAVRRRAVQVSYNVEIASQITLPPQRTRLPLSTIYSDPVSYPSNSLARLHSDVPHTSSDPPEGVSVPKRQAQGKQPSGPTTKHCVMVNWAHTIEGDGLVRESGSTLREIQPQAVSPLTTADLGGKNQQTPPAQSGKPNEVGTLSRTMSI